ncbi:hypothetical protein ACXYTJ_14160 [Gilvimarinus sp. F26214L]|uniref:hypothetical protein n=1 Tax=Gilvimarinus sp. DZF01 TaxID=3461371 RepID=UPI004045E8C2
MPALSDSNDHCEQDISVEDSSELYFRDYADPNVFIAASASRAGIAATTNWR